MKKPRQLKQILLLVLALIVAIMTWMSLSVTKKKTVAPHKTTPRPTLTTTPTATQVAEKPKQLVTFNVTTKDNKVTKDSTPVIVKIASKSDVKQAIAFYHAISPETKQSELKLNPGRYELTAYGVINNDGSVTKPVKTSETTTLIIDTTTTKTVSKVSVNIAMDKTIPADKVTKEEITEIKEVITEALTKGDKTLQGDNKTTIIERVNLNAKLTVTPTTTPSTTPTLTATPAPTVAPQTNNNISDTYYVPETKSTTKTTVYNPIPRETQRYAEKPTYTSPQITTKKPISTPVPTVKSTSKPTSPQTVKPTTKPTDKPKVWVPEQGHYEDIIEKVWIPNIVTIIDKPAWNEVVKEGRRYFRCSDGTIIYNGDELDNYEMSMIRAGTPISWAIRHEPDEIVFHPSESHTEDHGYYEDRIVGQKWVVDVPGHYE